MHVVGAPALVVVLLAGAVQDAADTARPSLEPSATTPVQDSAPATPLPRDVWMQARTAPDGPVRTAALVASLSDAAVASLAPGAVRERLEVAFQAFLGAEERHAADELLALAEALYARDPAPWSAFCLEGALRRGFGRYADAEAVLAEVAKRVEGDAPAVLAVTERRALVAAGSGESQRERALLGAAVARGSTDARQILGFAALRAGDRAAARAHFGLLVSALGGADASLAARDLPPWALRGHGVALLPGPASPSAGTRR
jgi:hypothetical protein